MVEALYAHLVAGNIAALARLFPQIAALDTPLSGAVDGDEALAAYVAREGAWLRERLARIGPAVRIEDDRHVAVELVLQLARDGASYELPVAIIASKLSGSFGQIRVYRSTWPIDGSHAYRAPIRWPSTELAEPPVVRAYFEGLARGDRDRVLQTFTQDGYVREPSGSSFIHSGPKGRAAFYEAVFGRPGGVPLVHVNSVWAGRVYAVEYICAAWGPARFPPMPGCAFYELTENGAAIRGVRIYDDVTPPSE